VAHKTRIDLLHVLGKKKVICVDDVDEEKVGPGMFAVDKGIWRCGEAMLGDCKTRRVGYLSERIGFDTVVGQTTMGGAARRSVIPGLAQHYEAKGETMQAQATRYRQICTTVCFDTYEQDLLATVGADVGQLYEEAESRGLSMCMAFFSRVAVHNLLSQVARS
jgi:hypothetical protein